MVVFLNGIPFAIVAMKPRVEMVPLVVLAKKKYSMMVRILPEGVIADPLWYDRVREYLLPQVGYTGFATRRLFRLAYRVPLGWRTGNEAEGDKLQNLREICSSLASSTLRYAFHYDPVPNIPDKWTTPTDLANTDRLVTVAEFLYHVESMGDYELTDTRRV